MACVPLEARTPLTVGAGSPCPPPHPFGNSWPPGTQRSWPSPVSGKPPDSPSAWSLAPGESSFSLLSILSLIISESVSIRPVSPSPCKLFPREKHQVVSPSGLCSGRRHWSQTVGKCGKQDLCKQRAPGNGAFSPFNLYI